MHRNEKKKEFIKKRLRQGKNNFKVFLNFKNIFERNIQSYNGKKEIKLFSELFRTFLELINSN